MIPLPLECDRLLNEEQLVAGLPAFPVVDWARNSEPPPVPGVRIRWIRERWTEAWIGPLGQALETLVAQRALHAVRAFQGRLRVHLLAHSDDWPLPDASALRTSELLREAGCLRDEGRLCQALDAVLRSLARNGRLYRTPAGIDGYFRRRTTELATLSGEIVVRLLRDWHWAERFHAALEHDCALLPKTESPPCEFIQ